MNTLGKILGIIGISATTAGAGAGLSIGVQELIKKDIKGGESLTPEYATKLFTEHSNDIQHVIEKLIDRNELVKNEETGLMKKDLLDVLTDAVTNKIFGRDNQIKDWKTQIGDLITNLKMNGGWSLQNSPDYKVILDKVTDLEKRMTTVEDRVNTLDKLSNDNTISDTNTVNSLKNIRSLITKLSNTTYMKFKLLNDNINNVKTSLSNTNASQSSNAAQDLAQINELKSQLLAVKTTMQNDTTIGVDRDALMSAIELLSTENTLNMDVLDKVYNMVNVEMSNELNTIKNSINDIKSTITSLISTQASNQTMTETEFNILGKALQGIYDFTTKFVNGMATVVDEVTTNDTNISKLSDRLSLLERYADVLKNGGNQTNEDIKKINDLITGLTTKSDDLNTDYNNLQTTLTNLQNKVNGLNILTTSQADLDEIINKVTSFFGNETHSTLKGILDSIESITDSVSALNLKVNAIDTSIKSLDTKLTDLINNNRSSITTLQGNVTQNTTDIASNKTEIEAIQLALNTLTGVSSSSTGSVASNSQSIADIKTQLETMKITILGIKTNTDNITKNTESIDKIKQDIVTINASVSKNSEDITNIINRLVILEGYKQTNEGIIARLQATDTELLGKIDDLTTRLNNFDTTVSGINRTVSGIHVNPLTETQIKQWISELETKITTARTAALNALQFNISNLNTSGLADGSILYVHNGKITGVTTHLISFITNGVVTNYKVIDNR